MKSNELFEMIHSGQVEDETKIDVTTEEGEHIAFIYFQNKRLNWTSGDFDTKHLCDINTEFHIINEGIKQLKLEGLLTGDKINAIENKINEIIKTLNQEEKEEKKEFPF